MSQSLSQVWCFGDFAMVAVIDFWCIWYSDTHSDCIISFDCGISDDADLCGVGVASASKKIDHSIF